MKKKMIEGLLYEGVGQGKLFSFYEVETGVWVMDGYDDGKPEFRYCIDTRTKEHASLANPGRLNQFWTGRGLAEQVGISYWYCYSRAYSGSWMYADDDSKAAAARFLKINQDTSEYSLFSHIIDLEQEYGRAQRQKAEDRRIAKVDAEMNILTADGAQTELDAQMWYTKTRGWDRKYLIKDHETGEHVCTGCHKSSVFKKLKIGDLVECPHCGSMATVENRRKEIREVGSLAIMHAYNGNYQSVFRFFDARCVWSIEGATVQYNEGVRICVKSGRPDAYNAAEALLKSANASYRLRKEERNMEIYYNTFTKPWDSSGKDKPYCSDSYYFDNKNNYVNRKAGKCILYPVGIDRALEHTVYETWTRAFMAAASQKLCLDYNRLLVCYGQPDIAEVVELLIKGRYYHLVEDMADNVSFWSHEYSGSVRIHEHSLETIMGMDKAHSNMLRDVNGGEDEIRILRLAAEKGMKLSADTLGWYAKEKIGINALGTILTYMSLEAAKNYLERQKRESYPGKTIYQVLSQYNDYIDMMKALKKNTADEMVYRCKELKRRHDECVEEINRQRQIEQMKRDKAYAKEQAKKLRQKYPTAEAVLKEIKPKFEYKNQNYMILVPKTLTEIVAEGSSLHHCVANTDRYFDRIMQNETYICFLRKASDPKLPFYTIEVEPGGTVRQHRGMYDEEPQVDDVKEFIKEWQKQLKKKLTKKDKQRAAKAKELRIKNIEELKRANNTRVLNGLIEDFMDAEVV